MKKLKKVLLSLLMVAAFTACSNGNNTQENETANETAKTEETSQQTGGENELEDKTYIIGLDDTFAPMGFRDTNGELVGFDVDLAKDVFSRLGKKLEFQPIDWSMKETELNAGNIDMIWNGYSITPEREKAVALSDPYIESGQVIVVMKDSGITKKSDLKGKTLTIQASSSALDALKKEGEVLNNLGQPPVEYADNLECFKDLEAKRSDAMCIDELFARYYISNQKNPDDYYILEENLGAESMAVGIKKDNTALVDAINKALKEQKEDGTYDKIYTKWLGKK
ncbi:MAG: amino acid ABC transporter substrate-binding protein [Finegoldia sp.]|nr:amino acid ABC transporter substrate-binding protein [Finegoldia sp.]